jgi:hypothetical protein
MGWDGVELRRVDLRKSNEMDLDEMRREDRIGKYMVRRDR